MLISIFEQRSPALFIAYEPWILAAPLQHMGQPDTLPLAGFGANPAPSHRAAMVLHTAKGKMKLYPA